MEEEVDGRLSLAGGDAILEVREEKRGAARDARKHLRRCDGSSRINQRGGAGGEGWVG